jgi:2-C-methyl-D-erythritol 4-phosphate cytidylyltransferase
MNVALDEADRKLASLRSGGCQQPLRGCKILRLLWDAIRPNSLDAAGRGGKIRGVPSAKMPSEDDPPVPRFAVILPAAGKSSRFRDQHYKKPFAHLDGRPVWMHAADKLAGRKDVVQTLLVIAPEDREHFVEKFGGNAALLGIEIVEGGAERADSVARALERVNPDADFVAVHDAARPCLVEEWIDAVFAAAVKSGAAILAAPVTGTLKRAVGGQTIAETVARDNLWEAQTPQVFRRQLLIDAYARRGSSPATDDAQLVERLGHQVTLVPCSPMNLKITTKEDLRIAGALVKILPRPKLANPAHPFADDDLWR